MYPGHARQAGHLAFACHAGNYLGRWVVVVGHDIDPSNTFDVIWALSTRCDPASDIDLIGKAWSGPLDPMLASGVNENSRAVVDACVPWERREDFPHHRHRERGGRGRDHGQVAPPARRIEGKTRRTAHRIDRTEIEFGRGLPPLKLNGS